MIFGFQFREHLSGNYHLFEAPTVERAVDFTVSAEVDGFLRFARELTATLTGEVTLEGFADKKPATGSLTVRWKGENRLVYRLNFQGNDGKPYLFIGQNDLIGVAFLDAMSVLPASLYGDDGAEIGRAILRFDAKHEIVKSVRTFSLTVLGFPVLGRGNRKLSSSTPSTTDH